ncbi:MAG: 1-deoxy-D-xylulose-5-phosphate synthase [Clostridia bacterium]
MRKTAKRLIDEINLPDGIKSLNHEQLDKLCVEIRGIIIDAISQNGGHLSSNLGIVELTVAMHRVFDFKEDVVVWDVGHQSYAHKILTGRKDLFHTVRRYKGISGFPKREESAYDFFNTGHSSTAISAAYGYAKAKTMRKEKGTCIAVVGDGAMAGGMSFEALNDAGSYQDDLLVILNDNEMSISKNVGSLPRYLERIREKSIYAKTNKRVKSLVERIPWIGKWLRDSIHRLKGAIKYYYTREALFEEFGFRYYGPVDGHDVKALVKILESIKIVPGPKLLHVITKKGKGYEKAECQPQQYHGVGKFDVLNGVDSNGIGKTFSEVTGELLTGHADLDPDVVVVCPAMAIGAGLTPFCEKYPERFFDVGIAEQHAVTFAAGMACQSLKPVVVMYSSFMQRAYDQMLHDVCLMNLHVVFCVDRAGIVPCDGETHQGIYDLAYLGHMPNLEIFAPSNRKDYEAFLSHGLYKAKGPVAIRYPKESCREEQWEELDPFKARILRNGEHITLISYGRILHECMKAALLLEEQGIRCAVIDLRCLKPLDLATIGEIAPETTHMICFEDSIRESGCGEKIGYYLKEHHPHVADMGC